MSCHRLPPFPSLRGALRSLEVCLEFLPQMPRCLADNGVTVSVVLFSEMDVRIVAYMLSGVDDVSQLLHELYVIVNLAPALDVTPGGKPFETACDLNELVQGPLFHPPFWSFVTWKLLHVHFNIVKKTIAHRQEQALEGRRLKYAGCVIRSNPGAAFTFHIESADQLVETDKLLWAERFQPRLLSWLSACR